MTTTTYYEKQAQAFLDRFGIKFRCTLSDTKVAPWSAGRSGHHYRVTLSKRLISLKSERFRYNSHRLAFDFWGSIANAEKGQHPTAYDVLSCISGDCHCEEEFKDWCGSFGESTDSITALQTFRRCKAFAARLQAFFTADEIEALGEIQ